MTKREARKVKWHDSRGFVHDKPINDNDLETSENGPLFTSVYLAVRRLNNRLDKSSITERYTSYATISAPKRYPRATAISDDKGRGHCSYDNVLGMYAFYKMSPRWEGVKNRLPSLWWWSEGKVYIRPESIFLMYCKYGFIKYVFGFVLYPYFMVAMILSLSEMPKESSGAQKWFLRSYLFLPSIYFKVAEKYLKLKGMSFKDVFREYYKYEDHPTVEEAKRTWFSS